MGMAVVHRAVVVVDDMRMLVEGCGVLALDTEQTLQKGGPAERIGKVNGCGSISHGKMGMGLSASWWDFVNQARLAQNVPHHQSWITKS